ncbi:MAG: uroporphyrinogen decarboxylase family protein [Eubacteriales bacterium]|nr:uroporphyrinogen decarboxylase family protein [Eubacteriales bacterium]
MRIDNKDELQKYLTHIDILPDELTALERSELLAKGKEVDRMPCCLDGGETMAPMLGFSIKDYYFSSEKMCELEEYMYRTFGTDGVGVSCTLRGMAEAMGAKVRYFDHNIAQIIEPAFSLNEVDRAKRVNIDEDGRLPIILKGVDLVKKKIGHEVPVSATVTGPFTIAAMTVGTENLLLGTIRFPEKVHQLMEVIVENNNQYIKRLIELGVGIGFADPLSSTSVISVKQYKTFSFPYFKKNVDYIKSYGRGCGLHICGKSKKIWDLLPETGIGVFGLDDIESLQEAKDALSSKIGLQGNVPPIDVMLMGDPLDVILSAKECIDIGKGMPCGYTLTSGCQMPIGTPQENMHALMNASRIFGRYK